jgi:2-polyprenyl-3-methyl-5-hydroxy-6-metoxy-1,4-benzoquinol methylase
MAAAAAGPLHKSRGFRWQRQPSHYKAARHSSHALLLAEFPEHGEGRHVPDVGCAAGYPSGRLAERGFAVTSIDWANTPHPPTILAGSAGHLDFPSSS